MQTVTLVSCFLVAVTMLLDAPHPASGECCGSLLTLVTKYVEGIGPVKIREQACKDCTKPTPYCGYGKCNVAGCNCDGGCRRGGCGKKRSDDGGDEEGSEYNRTSIIEAGDKNGDGVLSYHEAKTLLKRYGMSSRMEDFKDMDLNHDGKLTANEIDADD